jgi:hypothetical protein
MTTPLLDQIVDAVLYEGYMLYPYRPSSKKNRGGRFTFGRVYPKDYSEFQLGAEPCLKQTECLLQVSGKEPALEVAVRFLHPMWREAGYVSPEGSFQVVPRLLAAGKSYQTWQEATEREVLAPVGRLEPSVPKRFSVPFSFSAVRTSEPLGDGLDGAGAALLRRQEALQGAVEVEAEPLGPEIYKITVRVLNRTPMAVSQCDDPDAVLMRTFASTHTILQAFEGQFISLMDPPPPLKELAAQCKNIGTWPVLVGDASEDKRDIMLSSPIILYDYPQIAPESIGSFFDGTEIDEMLTLRVLTMTDGEKLEMRQADECARRILERTETIGSENLLKLHGTMREVRTDQEMKAAEEFFNPAARLANVFAQGRQLRAGDSVRIRPKNRADAIDMMLAGKTAVIEAIEQDAEGRIHLGLVVDDDPGKDLGMARQPGHRFFYGLDEIEPLKEASA